MKFSQPRPQGFSLKWVGRPTHFLREKPWGRGWKFSYTASLGHFCDRLLTPESKPFVPLGWCAVDLEKNLPMALREFQVTLLKCFIILAVY